MKAEKLAKLVMLLVLMGCSKKTPMYTSTGKEVLMEQRNISLYRKKPHIWPAKGKVIATADELIFIPTPYFGALYINGRDSTYISLSEINEIEEDSWMLLFPFGTKLVTDASATYDFVTVRRNKLIQSINQAKAGR